MTSTVTVNRSVVRTDESGTVNLDARTDATEQFFDMQLTANISVVLGDPVGTNSVLDATDFDGSSFRVIRSDGGSPKIRICDRSSSVLLKELTAAGQWADFMWVAPNSSAQQWRLTASGNL